MTDNRFTAFSPEELAALSQGMRDLAHAPGHLAQTADALYDEAQTVIDRRVPDEPHATVGGTVRSGVMSEASMNTDPRTGCWFDGMPAVALAPRHTGGDEDVPAHWIPVCERHLEHWHDELDAGERLPIIPRSGIALTTVQAKAILAATVEDSGDIPDSVNQEVDGLEDAVEALEAGLRAVGDDA